MSKKLAIATVTILNSIALLYSNEDPRGITTTPTPVSSPSHSPRGGYFAPINQRDLRLAFLRSRDQIAQVSAESLGVRSREEFEGEIALIINETSRVRTNNYSAESFMSPRGNAPHRSIEELTLELARKYTLKKTTSRNEIAQLPNRACRKLVFDEFEDQEEQLIQSNINPTNEGIECQICLDDRAKDYKTKCEHLFHAGCINSWVLAQQEISAANGVRQEPSCPACRQNLFQ